MDTYRVSPNNDTYRVSSNKRSTFLNAESAALVGGWRSKKECGYFKVRGNVHMEFQKFLIFFSK